MFDLHNDFPTAMKASEYRKYLSESAGGHTIVSAIWTTEFDEQSALDKTIAITDALESAGGAPIAIEDIGRLSSDAFALDFDRYFYCSLTWNYNNAFAGGALDDGGLTRKGRAVIDMMNGKCAVDLAHLNKHSFYDVLDAAAKPICSHTGFAEHPRCLDDGMIRALIARNVPIGLCAVRAFTGAATAAELAEAIDRFVQRYGIENLCIGTDFNGSEDLPDDFKTYADVKGLINKISAYGYANNDIDRILHDNAFNFYKELKT